MSIKHVFSFGLKVIRKKPGCKKKMYIFLEVTSANFAEYKY